VPDSFLDKEKTKDLMPQIAPLIGAARIGINGKVNVLPVEYRTQKAQEIQKSSIRIFGIAALTIFAVSFVIVNIKVSDFKNRLITTKERNKTLYALKEIYDKAAERESLINAVRAREVSTLSIMKEISNITPQNIVLDSLEIDQQQAKAAFKGIVYTAGGVGEVMLTDFMETIEKSPYFKEVNLETSEKGAIENNKVVFFTINCAIQK
jgi:Tfp pilus assembly protein PilN